MTKKLTILNIIILVLIFLANIGTFYGINYPIKFNFRYNFEEYGFEYILIVLIIIAIITALVSTLKIWNLSFKNKFLRIFALLNSTFLIFLMVEGFLGYSKNKKEYLNLENEYIQQAKKDIKNDNVTFKYAGGLTLPECNQSIQNKIDSVNKKYGVKYLNTGCIIMEQNTKAQEKYAEIVKPYLEKRNGKDWQEKMRKEIDIIKRDCR